MKYFIMAGERSGDLHASKLANQLKRQDVRAEIDGFGGAYMEREGVNIIKRYSSFSFMGILEVVSNLGKIKKAFREAKKAILSSNPDVLILVDFPGMNLKLATYARRNGIKTCYYISPKIWAWRSHRIKRIKRDIDRMLVILPFEVAYYKASNYMVDYVGNPLIDSIRDYEYDQSFLLNEEDVNVAILPGSRKQEIEVSSNIIRQLGREAPEYKFHIAGVDNVDPSLYEPYKSLANTKVYMDKTYEILKQSNVAIVTSGTATLEAALLNCPQVVVYKANPVCVCVVKMMVKIKWISLVNLIAQKRVVKELIQKDYTSASVLNEINLIINDPQYCAGMMADYQQLREKIGTQGASKKVADLIIEWLESSRS